MTRYLQLTGQQRGAKGQPCWPRENGQGSFIHRLTAHLTGNGGWWLLQRSSFDTYV